MAGEERLEWDYVIVGSARVGHAGGTPGGSGMRVFVAEGGGDPLRISADRLPEDYEVPAFHAAACEESRDELDFRVRHYADEQRQARDPKYERERACSILGGCTRRLHVHNA